MEQARQISQRICNRVSAARGIKYYTIFMAAHTGGLNNRQKHKRGAGVGKGAKGCRGSGRGEGCSGRVKGWKTSCGCKCWQRNHKQLLATNCCMFLEFCLCRLCVSVCCLLIKSRKTIKKITAYNLQTVMFAPPPSHSLCTFCARLLVTHLRLADRL